MIYAQFFHMSTGYIAGTIPPKFDDAHKTPIEVCGSDGVLILDGRLGTERMAEMARDVCQKRKFCGYRIFRGERFSDATPISGYWPVPQQTAENAIHRVVGM